MTMQLNIREMLEGDPNRLRYVYRYSTSRVHHQESVAEHSYYVAFYSLMIGQWVQSRHQDRGEEDVINFGKLLTQAIMHDLEEARSGDFPRPFKHSSDELKQMLDKSSRIAMEQMLNRLIPGHESIDQLYRSMFYERWHKAKCNSWEGLIVEFADFLCVLSFMREECLSGGNRSIQNHVREMDKYFELFHASSYDFIRPLVDDVAKIVDELFEDNADHVRLTRLTRNDTAKQPQEDLWSLPFQSGHGGQSVDGSAGESLPDQVAP